MADDPVADFALLLRRHRVAAGLTQEALAARAGLSARGISDLERGVRRVPQRETVRLLATGLGLGPAEHAAMVAAARRPSAPARLASVPPGADPFAGTTALTPFVGRATERERLGALLGSPEATFLTVTGPGGVGKTRLAVEAARLAGDAFPGGRWFVDLTALRRPREVLPAVAATVVPGFRGDPVATVLHATRGRRSLLVVDNGEHLLDAGPDLADLTRRAPGLTVLATSRERFGVRGEQEVPLGPLPVPSERHGRALETLANVASVALFVGRVRAVDPDFALTGDNAGDVATICARLDGLPLAIELAAARAKVLPPAVLARRLDRRLPLLTEGPRDLPERQRTLRDAIAWSHDLLDPDEQRAFRWLAVFAGGWTEETAALLLDPLPDGEALRLVGALVDKGLAVALPRAGGSVRFRMLETIREFGLEQLAASGEETAARSAHADAVRRFLQRHTPVDWNGESVRASGRLQGEFGEYRAALGWLMTAERLDEAIEFASLLPSFWFDAGTALVGRRWLAAMLPRRPTPDRRRAQMLLGMGIACWVLNDFEAAVGHLEECLEIVQVVGDDKTSIQARVSLAAVLEFLGDEAGAERNYRQALDVATEHGSRYWSGMALLNLSDCAYRRGDLDAAEQLSLEALPIVRETNLPFDRPMTLATLAHLAAERGDPRRAAAFLDEALDAARREADSWVIADLLAAVAAVAAAEGDVAAAAWLLGASAAEQAASGRVRLPHQPQRDRVAAAVSGVAGADVAWRAGAASSRGEAFERAGETLAEPPT